MNARALSPASTIQARRRSLGDPQGRSGIEGAVPYSSSPFSLGSGGGHAFSSSLP